MLDTHELAWAAGFYDGEGCTSSRAPSDRVVRKVTMAVSQVHPEVLQRFQRAVGVGSITGPFQQTGNQRPIHHWAVSSKDSVHLVAWLLWPWLGTVKRDQIERSFATYHARAGLLSGPGRGGGNRSKTVCKRGHAFDEENTYVYRGRRSCRTCHRESHRRHYEAKKGRC